MPVLTRNVSEQVAADLELLAEMINNACEKGDNVTAIAARIGVARDVVSGLRNGTYRYDPAYSLVKALCSDLGGRLSLVPGRQRSSSTE